MFFTGCEGVTSAAPTQNVMAAAVAPSSVVVVSRLARCRIVFMECPPVLCRLLRCGVHDGRRLDVRLVGAVALGYSFSIPAEQLVDDFHSLDNPPERNEALVVEPGVPIGI